jgi:hypothetical protein
MGEKHEDRGFRSIGSLVPKIGSSLKVSDSTPTTQWQSSATTGARNPALVASTGTPSGARTAGASLSGNTRDLAGARPTRPILTPRLRLALEWSARSVYPEGRPSIPIPNGEWQPPVADAALLAEAERQIGGLEDYLAPINPVRLSLRIDALLRTYWMAESEYQFADELTMQLYVEALARYPEWAVHEAIADWFGNVPRRPSGADLANLCRAAVASASVELDALRRVVNPWEQEQARLRRKEAEAERQRAVEREAFNTANPGWTTGLPHEEPRERPMEPEPFDKGRYRAAIEQLKNFRLPDPDDPKVLERMRRWEEGAIYGQSRGGATDDLQRP